MFSQYQRAMRDTMASFLSTTTTTTDSQQQQQPQPIIDERVREILARKGAVDSVFVEHLPPSHDEMSAQCLNRVLGMQKMAPLVDAHTEPVTRQWREESHTLVRDLILQKTPPSLLEYALGRVRWLDLELASHLGVCIDRFHLAPSVAYRLDGPPAPAITQEFERASYHKNIPAILLRRILRAELQQQATPGSEGGGALLLRRYLDFCRVQEPPALDEARWAHNQKEDLHWLLAGYTSTLAYLFPLDDNDTAGGISALHRTLGRPENTFRAWKIPPPRHDPALLDALGVDAQGNPTGKPVRLDVLRRHYQLYTTVLWRLVKAHRLQSVLLEMVQAAERTIFHVPYARHRLKLVEHRVQLFIDTHLDIYAWALGDGVWTDADWFVGPGGRELALRENGAAYTETGLLPDHVDADRESPIVRFFPHCRAVHPCEDELPEITTTIPHGNITHDLNVKPSNPTLLQAWLHFVACKLFPHRCLTRNNASIILRYVKGRKPKDGKPPFVGYSSLKEFILLVLRCGLLGNWKFAGTRANFAERIAIEYPFMPILVPASTGERFDLAALPSNPNEDLMELFMEPHMGSHPTRISYRRWLEYSDTDSFTNWIENNSDLTFYLFKEYYAHMFNTLPALDVVMARYTTWGYYKNLMFASMDQIRRHINIGGGFAVYGDASKTLLWSDPLNATPEHLALRRQVMEGVRKITVDVRRLSKRTFIKLHKAPFINVFLRFANAANGFYQIGKMPSGRFRKGLAGDDDPELLVKRAYDFQSTADVIEIHRQQQQETEAPSKKRRRRNQGGNKKKKGKRARRGGSDSESESGEEDDDEDEEDEEDDEEEEEEEGDEGGEGGVVGIFNAVFNTTAEDSINALELGMEEAARRKAIRDEEDEEASASDRNLTAMAKQIRQLAKALPQIDLTLMDAVTRDIARRRQTTMHPELAPLVELFHVAPDIVARVRLIYSHYVTFDMPDYQLLERNYNLMLRDRRSFDTLRLYMSFLIFHGQQILMPLTQQTRRRQLAALRLRWKVPIFQDMPQDLSWAYYSAGTRRFFSVEACAPKYKTTSDRDRSLYARDLRGALQDSIKPYIVQRHNLAPAPKMSKAQDILHMARIAAAVEHSEKMSERMYSVNMERATYNSETNRLYARRKTDPSLRSLRAASNLVLRQDRPDVAPESEDLVDEILADVEPEEEVVAAAAIAPEEEEDDVVAHPNLPFDRIIVDNEDLVIRLDTATGLQLGRLTERARIEYRRSAAAMQTYFDAGSRDALVPIDTIGRVVNMGGRPTVNCVHCGVLTPYETGKIDSYGPHCGLHDLNALTRANRKFLRANAQASTLRPSQEAHAILYQARLAPPKKEKKKEEEEPEPLSDCIFCQLYGILPGPESSRLSKYQIIFRDEETGKHELRVASLCARDARYAGKHVRPVESQECYDYEMLHETVKKMRIQHTIGFNHQHGVKRSRAFLSIIRRKDREAERASLPPPDDRL